MKSKAKRMMTWILALAMVLSLAACGSSGTSGSAEGGAAQQEDKGGAGKTKVVFWHQWQGLEAEKFLQVIEKFHQEQDEIQVEVLDSTTKEKQLNAMQGGGGFDIGLTMDTSVNLWASVGALQELDDYIAAENFDVSNQVEGIFKLAQMNGKTYGIPFTMDTYAFLYNKDILEELGYSAPPTTYAEWAKMSEEAILTNEAGDYTRLGYVPDYPWINYSALEYAAGGVFVDVESGEVACDSPEMLGALQFKSSFYSAPYDTQKVLKFKSGFGQYQSAQNAFFTGEVVFAIEGEWYPTFIKEFAPDLNYGVAPLPTPDGDESAYTSVMQGGMMYIPKSASEPEAAFKFMQWLSGAPQVEICIAKGNLPATYSGLDDPALVEQSPGLAPFVELAKGNAKAYPAVPFMGEMQAEMEKVAEAIYMQEIPADEAMKQVKEAVQPLADKWKKG